ncbi:MAG: DUF5667 domain-containing protein [Candidatus Peribacteraceae bacterium]|nr:DUF5667 domain-containing protein [Candidatus Peribacteraceae bacterium]
MSAESRLHRLQIAMAPKPGVKTRVRSRIFQQIEAPKSLLSLSSQLTPSSAARSRLWQRVSAALSCGTPETVWQKIRDLLSPQSGVQEHLRARLLNALSPVEYRNPYARLKWVAAVAVVAMIVHASPSLFLTTPTVADSKVLLIPTRGQVSISVGDLWQDVYEEIVVEPGMRVRTYDGEASILYHDDAVIRLGTETMFIVHSTREEGDRSDATQFSLIEGRVWLQGLIPPAVPGVTVAMRDGSVTVHEASVSIEEQQDAGFLVKVWDRSVALSYNQGESMLMMGEQTQLRASGAPLIKKIPDAQFNEPWALQNLQKDAVHRRYISHLQHERRIAAAGILPTSNWYSVKRVAESMDVLFSVSSESRVQKRLQQATVRLNEAAALLTEGADATSPLEDFRDTLLSLSSGTGGNLEEQALIQQSVAETISAVAASLPGEDSYVLKRAVLEVAADLPNGLITPEQAQTVLLVDSLASLDALVKGGDASTVEEAWLALQPYLGLLDDSSDVLDPQARKEAKLLLARLASEVDDTGDIRSSLNPEILSDIVAYLPARPSVVAPMLSEEQVAGVIQSILGRIYAFKMPRSRENQLHLELTALETHNERGRLLRSLYNALPEDSALRERTRKELMQLRWEKAAEQYVREQQRQRETATGATSL